MHIYAHTYFLVCSVTYIVFFPPSKRTIFQFSFPRGSVDVPIVKLKYKKQFILGI